jgi:hypothetical protein
MLIQLLYKQRTVDELFEVNIGLRKHRMINITMMLNCCHSNPLPLSEKKILDIAWTHTQKQREWHKENTEQKHLKGLNVARNANGKVLIIKGRKQVSLIRNTNGLS